VHNPARQLGEGGYFMQLKLKRAQREGGVIGKKIIFALDARADLSSNEQDLVKKYGLGPTVIYDSANRRKHAEAAVAHADASVGASALGGMYKLARGYASLAMSALSLRVTVDSLTRGQHIECKDLDELLGAEAAIVEACQSLKSYLEAAVTFDGREEVVEF
jgi:hypothetical protein